MKNKSLLKVAVVIQRYGRDIIGGAEMHARMLVERLNRHENIHVEVFTSCAKNHMTWANDYPAGRDPREEIPVFRFQVERSRSRLLGLQLRLLKFIPRAPQNFRRNLEKKWIASQGPFTPGLINALKQREHEFNCCLAFTYLYYPTMTCLQILQIPIVLIPMAHDETPWYFLETSESLKHAHSILANTEAEKKFIQRTKPEISSKIQVAGIGLEDQRNGSYELKLATENAFNLLYLGRIGKGKAIHELLRYFLRECLNKRVILHLAGPVEDGFELPQKNSSVLYHGRVDEAQKQELIKEADCIVNPSHHESMSILVLEAIAAGKPVLAQAECEVFQEYANDYDTVYLFSDTKSFWNQLSTMRADQPNLELRLSANSKKLRSKYQWSNIEQLIISSLYEAQGGLNTQDERRSR